MHSIGATFSRRTRARAVAVAVEGKKREKKIQSFISIYAD
jgi:hypothetical protein